MSCPPGHSIAGCAAIGAIAGGVGGAIAGLTGGLGGGFAMAMLGGGLSAAGSDATSQLLTTGHIDVGELAESAVVGAAAGGVLHGAGKLGSVGCGGNSFAAGTSVLMADGTHKPIEDVRIGDKVIATDPTTGKTSAQPVTNVIVGSGSKNLVSIAVAAVSGASGTNDATASGRGSSDGFVIATANHPFWVDDQGQPVSHDPTVGGHWEDAYSLTAGQHLEGVGGKDAGVVSTDSYTLTTTVYNLTVDGVHTYYVLAGQTPVLVHNEGCISPLPGRAPEGSTLEQYAEVNRGANQAATPDFVTEYTSPSGGRYYGRTSGDTEIEPGSNLDDALGSSHRDTCSEVCALNEAQKAEGGLAIYGGSFRTLRVRPQGSPLPSGVEYAPCKESCQPLIRKLYGTY
jgi:hypothetical protein